MIGNLKIEYRDFSYISEDGKILEMHLESFGRIDSCIFVGATAIENKARAYADFF